tara:strand:+ start:235 stop:453 length:219 start_codon:yes stop_codon:yes gene_type:complete
MTIEEESIQFLESQISNNYKEIFDKYLIYNIEWLEFEHGTRPIANIKEATTDKLSNIIVLFPYFNPSADITK